MTIEGIGLVVIGGDNIIIFGASSVEVEYTVLVCHHNNYSLCCDYISIVISRAYALTSIISVFNQRVLGVEKTQN